MEILTLKGPQGRLSVIEGGRQQGLGLLFLHADPGCANQWRYMLGELGNSYRVAALDSRGHGNSDPPANGDYSYAGRAEDVAAVADGLDLQRFVIVAHSAGGAVALDFAAKHPDRVEGLLLVDPPTDPRLMPDHVREQMLAGLRNSGGMGFMEKYVRSIAGDNRAVVQQVTADSAAVSAEANLGMAEALVSWNPEKALKAWDKPLLILVSQASDTDASIRRLGDNIPHQVIGGSGHWLQLDQPDNVERAIRDFVAGLDREKD